MEFIFDEPGNAAALAAAFPGYADGFVRLRHNKLFMPLRFQEEWQSFKNLPVRSDDIWVLSFPKSGTTWTQEMVWLIANDFNYEGAKELLRVRFPFVEEMALIPKSWQPYDCDSQASSEENGLKYEDAVPTAADLLKLPSPRFLKTHLPLSCLPDDLLDTCKVVYVARNPKDVAVSWYFHHNLDPIMETPLTLPEFAELFIRDEVLYAPFWNNVLESWQRREHPNMLFLFYEDLKEDLLGNIEKVARFLGKTVTEERVARLVRHLSIDNFRKNPAVNCEDLQNMGVFRKEGSFVRQGQSGGWRKHFTEQMNETFDKWIERNSASTDLTFKYA